MSFVRTLRTTLLSRRAVLGLFAVVVAGLVAGCSGADSASAANLTAVDLGSLRISQGTITPLLSKSASHYTATVGNAVGSITVTASPAEPTSTLRINGTLIAPGAASPSIPLTVGANTITLVVTAEDGISTRTYTLTVTRSAPAT